MATTTNLGITKLEENQAGKVAAINAALDTIDGTLGGQLTKSVAGNSNVNLTANEAANAILKFTGTLTGNIDVTVPASTKRTWTVWDATSGAYAITFKVLAGTGIKTRQGKVDIFFSDGTNMDLASPGTTVRQAGTAIATRRNINISDTGSVTWTIADDAANDEIDISATSSGGGGGGDSTHTSAYGSRPSASNAGDLFLPSDGYNVQRDTGAAWVPWGPLFSFTEPPAVSGFAWVNQGAATGADSKGAIVMTAPASASDNLRILKKTAPATPYTITVAMLPTLAGANYCKAGLCWRESSSGKVIDFGVGYSTVFQLSATKWTNATTYSADYASLGMLPLGVIFLRISDDGTNRKCSFSTDGQNFVQVHSVGRTDFMTADEIGLLLNENNANYTAAATFLSYVQA